MKHLILCLLLVCLGVVGAAQHAVTSVPAPRITATVDAAQGLVIFAFDVDNSAHITDLKNDFFKVTLLPTPAAALGKVEFPAGAPLGDEHVFKGQFTVRAWLRPLQAIRAPTAVKFEVSYQMCKEFPQEVCFPPDSQTLEVTLPAGFAAAFAAAPAVDSGFAARIEASIKEKLRHPSFMLFLLIFLAGFLASLTPCVYPVIPIVMGYVGSRSDKKKSKGFLLSLCFVLGLALVYSILGVVAAKTGALVGSAFQNPVVVVIVAAIIIAMGLSLAGLFDIPVPASIASKVGTGYKSGFLTAVVLGGISAVIAAPCVGPVLIALLTLISQTGNLFLGFWLTFTFSLGMSVIFIVAGTFSGAISALPRGGAWMETIKYFFSILLIAGGIYFLAGILPGWSQLLAWGAFLTGLAVFAGLFAQPEDDNLAARFKKWILVLVLVAGVFLLWHGLSQRYFPAVATAAASHAETGPTLPWLHDIAPGQVRAKQEQKVLLLDFGAEWCTACKELERETFPAPAVAELMQKMVLVKVDCTQKNDQTKAVQREHGVLGLPTLIFIDTSGKELERFSGFMAANDFVRLLQKYVK
jgi:thioredoxin:protein disulfide reductase